MALADPLPRGEPGAAGVKENWDEAEAPSLGQAAVKPVGGNPSFACVMKSGSESQLSELGSPGSVALAVLSL